jgi:hypothetical protein
LCEGAGRILRLHRMLTTLTTELAYSLFMLTMHDPRPPENAKLFAKKIGSTSPYTYCTHLISHHPTSFSSDTSNIIGRESLFHHLRQFMKLLGSSRDQSWRTCFGTE